MSLFKWVSALSGPFAVLTPLLLASCGGDTELELRSSDGNVIVQFQARVMEGAELEGRYLDRVGVSAETKLKLPEIFGHPVSYSTGWLGSQIPEFAWGPATLFYRIGSDSELARVQAILKEDLYRPISDAGMQVDFRQDAVLAVASDCGHLGNSQPKLARMAISEAGTQVITLDIPDHGSLIHFAKFDAAPTRESLLSYLEDPATKPQDCLNLFRIPASAKAPYSVQFREWFEAEELGLTYDTSRYLFSLDEVYEAPPSGATVVSGKDLSARLLGILDIPFPAWQPISRDELNAAGPELHSGFVDPLFELRQSGRLHSIESDRHQTHVIKNWDSFHFFWQAMHTDSRFPSETPTVDFSKYQVAVREVDANHCSSRFYKHMIEEPEQTILVEVDVGVFQGYLCTTVYRPAYEAILIPASSRGLVALPVSSDNQGYWR